MSTDKILMFYFIGMFMVKVTFLSDSAKILASSERSVSMRFLWYFPRDLGIQGRLALVVVIVIVVFSFFFLIVRYVFDFLPPFRACYTTNQLCDSLLEPFSTRYQWCWVYQRKSRLCR